jgi:AmmeMemoRadiSam system protein B/AmmeMemoRadiSam system protein A
MMKQLFCYILSILLTVCFVSIPPAKNACAAGIRKAVWAGRFYPASRSELEQAIDRLTIQAKLTRVQIPPHKQLKALILPHAGYVYSGLTAAHASPALRENRFDRVILMGPDHRVGFNNCAISDVDAYETPLGLVSLNKDAAKLRASSDLFQSIPASDRVEHSLEVVLPFLQRYLNEFEFIPIVMGRGNAKRLAAAIEPLLDQNSLLVVSSDLSHFLPYPKAVERDRETISMILNLESDKLLKSSNRACGIIPILIVLEMAEKHGWEPVLLHYSNSGDTAGKRSQVVGYAAIAFYGDSSMQKKHNQQQIDPQLGQALIKLARQTIIKRLGLKISGKESDLVAAAVKDEALKARCGTFVTLKIAGNLRGCIGSLSAEESIVDGVKRNAISAAFHDPRFSPVTVEEIEDVDIEISILTKPQPLEYIDSVDLISKLRVNIDGVILKRGPAGATFLPQVWEQLPLPEDFLSHLCVKAGLLANAWKNTRLEISTYQVQYFEEKK